MESPTEDGVFEDGRLTPVATSQVGIQAMLATLATIFVALRLYSRVSLKKKVFIDDVLLTIGLVSHTFQRICRGPPSFNRARTCVG
jgi:hypothetical protein